MYQTTVEPLADNQQESAVVFENISHAFKVPGTSDVRVALADVTITAPAKQFVAIVGPSGCGKTTLLNMAAGLIKPLQGSVFIDGHAVERPTRTTGYMFARDALLPWRTARANVEVGLELGHVARAERREIALQHLAQVGLEGYAESYPRRLSQGQRQRVALARTLAMRPKLLLMDEPFAALDAQTRQVVQGQLIELWEAERTNVIFVTHDLAEAVTLADRVIVLHANPGRVCRDVTVPIPRPRDIDQVRFDPVFQDTLQELWDGLREAGFRAH